MRPEESVFDPKLTAYHTIDLAGVSGKYFPTPKETFVCVAGSVVVCSATWRNEGGVVPSRHVTDGRPANWAQRRVATRGDAQDPEGRLRHRSRRFRVSWPSLVLYCV